MHMSFQGNPAPSSSRLATAGVAVMMVLAGLLTMSVAAPGVVAQNSDGPTVSAAVFGDTDLDGYLETVDVTFALDGDGESLRLATIRPSDFTIKLGTSEIVPHGCRTTTTAPIHCSSEGDSTFRFYFDELRQLDGGLVPDLLYNGGAYDTGDDAAKSVGAGDTDLIETTAAFPYFLRAFGATDSKDVLYWFTERVKVRDVQSPLPQTPKKDAFCWVEGGNPSTEGGITIDDATFSSDAPTVKVALSGTPSTQNGDLASVLRAVTTLGEQDGSCELETILVDLDGLAVSNHLDYKPFTAPITLKAALGSVGSTKLVLAFDGPVAAPNGGAITLDVANAAFDYDNQNPGGASNFVGVQHVAGSSRVTLTLNNALTLGDLQGTQSNTADGIDLAAGGLIGAGSQVFGADSIKLEAGSFRLAGAASTAAGTVADRWDKVDLAPRATVAGTRDLDGDGFLDAIRVAFDQPVTVGATPVFSVQTVVGPTVTAIPVTGVVGPAGGTCATDSGTTATASVSPAANEVWVCIEDWSPTRLGTGAAPQVSFNGEGVEDAFGNVATPFAGLASVDEAAPVALAVETVDLDPASPRPNGRIDGLRVTASEPVQSSSYVPGVFQATHQEGSTTYTYTVTSSFSPTGDTFVMGLQERTDRDGDTDVTPKLVYNPGSVSQSLKDAAGNAMPAFTFEQADTTDGAPPRLVRVLGTVGSNTLTVTFSEPVESSTSGALGTGAFAYTDSNSAGAGAVDNVQPTGSAARWSLILSAPLVAGDVGNAGDLLRVRSSSVYDATGQAVPEVTSTIATAAAILIQEVRTRDYFDFSDFEGTATTGAPQRTNGLIDTLQLVFATPVDDGFDSTSGNCLNLDPAEWRVKVGTTVLEPTFMVTYAPPPETQLTTGWSLDGCQDPTGTSRNGRTVYLVFSETEAWDTGITPTVDHLGDVHTKGGSAQPDGRVLTGVDAGDYPATSDIPTVDRANPVLTQASGSAGHDQLTLTFSEKVTGTGTDGRVRASDLRYVDGHVDAASASGFSSISSGSGGVRSVLATTNNPLDGNDMGADGVMPFHVSGQHPSGSSIKDLADNKVVYKDFVGGSVDKVAKIVDSAAPFVTGRLTRDADADGFLDGVELTFNEQVKLNDDCVDEAARWSITVDGEDAAVTRVTAGAPGTCPAALSTTLFVEFNGKDANAGTGSVVRLSYSPPTAKEDAVTDNDENRLLALTSQTAADGAAPVLMKLDGTSTPPGTKAQAETVDSDGDGIVDALRVRFSEPVDPDSFEGREADWQVDDDAAVVHDFEFDGAVVKLLLTVPSGAVADTAVKPKLEYAPPTDVTKHVKDFATPPNTLSPTRYEGTGSELETVDGAAPVILPATSSLTGKVLKLTFSENVYNDGLGSQGPVAGDSIGSNHIDYLNNNAGSTNDASTGRVRVTHTATVDANIVEVEFNAEPTTEDKDQDRLRLLSIYDASGVQTSATRASLTGDVDDQEPPAKITNLQAVAAAGTNGNAIALSWTNPPKDANGVDDLSHLVITIDDINDNKAAQDITASTVSDPATPPSPTASTSQNLKVTGVDSGKTYRFTIRAVDDTGNQGPVSEPAQVRVPFLDTVAPGAITDLAVDATTGNSATLKWTAPGDKDGEGNDVKVAGYEVRVSTTAITAFTQGDAATFTLDPSTRAVAGGVQKATVTGLTAETTYHFAVRAVDARPNAGGFDTASGTTGAVDTTAPVGTPVVTSSTHPSGTAVENDSPTFSWTAVTDAESDVTYHYVLSRSATAEVTDTAPQTDLTGSTTQLSKGFTDLEPGTWHFHLRAFSQGGSTAAVSYRIIIQEADAVVVDPADIAAANQALQATVKVTRTDGDNVVAWTLPETDETVAGVQVWRSTSPFELLVDLDALTSAFGDGEYVDEGAPEDATYIVTLYFSKDPVGGQVEAVADAPPYDTMTEEQLADSGVEPVDGQPPLVVTPGDDGLPAWLWLLIVVGFLGLVAAVVVPVVLTRRKRGAGWDEPAQWDETWGDDAHAADGAPDVDDGLEHYIECPKCDHGFEAHGEKPLETTCPNCGVRGVLN